MQHVRSRNTFSPSTQRMPMLCCAEVCSIYCLPSHLSIFVVLRGRNRMTLSICARLRAGIVLSIAPHALVPCLRPRRCVCAPRCQRKPFRPTLASLSCSIRPRREGVACLSAFSFCLCRGDMSRTRIVTVFHRQVGFFREF